MCFFKVNLLSFKKRERQKMGNNGSRVAPARTLHILDSQTRARYQNQRELVQLRVKLGNIQIQRSDALSRLALERHEVRTKLHELQHENGQRQLLKKLQKRRLLLLYSFSPLEDTY